MSLPNKQRLSIQSRFNLATALSVITFIVIALILVVAFIQVRSNLSQVVETQLQSTIDNAHLARELGQFLARLKQLEATFYGRDEYLQQEGEALRLFLDRQTHGHIYKSLQELHDPFTQKLLEYLNQCRTINDLIRWRKWTEEGLGEYLVTLLNIVAERTIEAASNEDQVHYYEQLSLLVEGYRISLLEIIQSGLQRDTQALFNASFFDPPPYRAQISSLIARLETVTSAEAPINRFGRHLADQLDYYQHLLVRYQQEMILLGRRTAELNQFAQLVLEQMDGFEKRQIYAIEQTGQEIDQTIIGTGAVVLALQVVLALFLGLIHNNLFTHHISRPMEKVRKRLLRFQEGDYSSPMSLNRNDEWGQIEQVFDGMLTDLVESWSDLQESERRYRNIFESASEGIFQSTVEGAFLNVNPSMGRMFGLGNEDNLSSFNNLRKQIYVNPADRDRLISRLLVEDKVNDYQIEMRRINGETFWATINCHLVRDNKDQVRFIEGTVEDISLRRQAEEALQQLKEYLHAIVDAMPSIMIGVNSEQEITLWNQQAVEVSGSEEDVVIGKPLQDILTFVEPSYQPAVEETLVSGKVVRLHKIAGLVKHHERFFDLLVYPISDADAPGAMIHMDDITEKIKIEDMMVQSEKMLSVGSLAAGMAHEINNPLASVLQNIQVMSQRLSPALDKNRQTAEQLGISIEQVAEYARLRGFEQMMKSISAAGQRAARVIENMLNFSRKSSSNFLLCSMTDLLEKTLELAASDYDMKHQFDFRSIKIIRDYQPVPDVPCEPSQMQQVILSLLKNAAQAVSAHTVQPEIQIRVFAREELVCVQIEDNGVGMEEAAAKRVFEPFYTTKEVGVGTGLGLSVAYFLITENHKGNLTLSSEPGQGSCVTIMLPLSPGMGR